MPSLRVLITNCRLCGCSGTEMYVHDLALRLLARGHRPLVYSPQLGPLAQRLSEATISTVSDLSSIAQEPDVIHGHHSLETLLALLHFPTTPAIYVCHDWNWVHDTPPQLPRVRRFIAVDETVRERLVIHERVPDDQIDVIFNGVDLQRFQPRRPLPFRPRKALVFSNYVEPVQFQIIEAACRRQGIALDGVGAKLGEPCAHPEQVLGQYDLVFAKGRCAWESLAVGAAVIVCDTWGLGSLVTTTRLSAMRRANFGRRLLQAPLTTDFVARELAQYDAADATEVSRQIRATAGVEQMVDRLVACYEEVIGAQCTLHADPLADMRATAGFLRHWPGLNTPTGSGQNSLALHRSLPTVHDGLKRARRTTGVRKWLRSIQKRWSQIRRVA